MPTKGELAYFKNMDQWTFAHAANKPWSDEHCGRFLMELGALAGIMPRRGKLLDLGCGTGWTSYYFAKMGYDVVGQDVAPEAIQYAQRRAADCGMDNLAFVEADYESMSFEPVFDIAVFFDSLHHAIDEKMAVRSAYRALKPGGMLITSEPGIGHHRRSRKQIEAHGVTERDMHPSRIIRAGKAAGFTSSKIYPHAGHAYLALYANARHRWLGRLFDVWGTRTLAALFTLFAYKYFDGIVVLRK